MAVLTEEQTMLRDAAKGWTTDSAPVGALRKLRDGKSGKSFDPAAWAQMGQMGWAGVIIPEEHNGSAFGYLGLQLMLSYFISGWVKVVNPEWRDGRALADVFRFSAYPVSEDLRRLADRPRLLLVMSWAVMLFELAFPLTLLSRESLIVGLVIAGTFHLANACLFGLNRFFWTWLSVYPAILWLQARVV